MNPKEHWFSGYENEELAIHFIDTLRLYGLECWRDGTEIYGPAPDALAVTVVSCMEGDELACDCLRMHRDGDFDLSDGADTESTPLHRLCGKFAETLGMINDNGLN